MSGLKSGAAGKGYGAELVSGVLHGANLQNSTRNALELFWITFLFLLLFSSFTGGELMTYTHILSKACPKMDI
jgi:hypothetical protein